MGEQDYWAESLAIAAEECDEPLKFTPKQLAHLASAMSSAHEHYGMAFYSPPPSDRISDIEREWKRKLKEAQDELEQYRGYAEKAVIRAASLPSDAKVTIDRYGAHRID